MHDCFGFLDFVGLTTVMAICMGILYFVLEATVKSRKWRNKLVIGQSVAIYGVHPMCELSITRDAESFFVWIRTENGGEFLVERSILQPPEGLKLKWSGVPARAKVVEKK